MESDKELKLVKAELQSNEAGDDFLILVDQLVNLQGRVRRGLSFLPDQSKPANLSCAERGALENIFLRQVSRRPRTSMVKKRKRVESYNNVEIVGDNVPNVVIRWKNWWAYEGEEDRYLEKLVDKRKGRRRCERWSRSRDHLNHRKASSFNEEELNTSHECHGGLHKVETTIEDLSAPKQRCSFNQQISSDHNAAKTPSQIDLDELFSFSSYKELTGLECLRSAYSGRSEEFMEENSSSDACNRDLLYQRTEENLKQFDSVRLQDAMIVLPGSSSKKVLDDITQNGNSFPHTNIRITGTQTTMNSNVFENMLESGQGTGRFSKAGVENSKELKSASSKNSEVATKDIVMECPICKMPLHGDVNKEDDIREVNRHIDACLSRCGLES